VVDVRDDRHVSEVFPKLHKRPPSVGRQAFRGTVAVWS
jgi:hypothetical protein